MKTNYLKLTSALLALFVVLPLFADTTNPDDLDKEFPHKIKFKLGSSDFAAGDNITIQEVRGSDDSIHAGGVYCVIGTYTLGSQDEADLSLFATTTNRIHTKIDPKQTTRVQKGAGTFRLIKTMGEDGYLHVTFYSRATGQGFGGVYFGQGKWVLRESHFAYRHTLSKPVKQEESEPVSNTGANRILFDYLGNPVPSPADLDEAYTKDGLTRAMQTAAQNAGISLVKLQIDDSEFPFLVGVVFSGQEDKAKFKEEVAKMPSYELSGGVGGEIAYVMNIVPSRAFPPESSMQVYHRMMLREAVFFDKMTGAKVTPAR